MKKTFLLLFCFITILSTDLFAKKNCKQSGSKFNFELHINTGRDSFGYNDPYFANSYCNDLEPIYVIAPKRRTPNIVIVNESRTRPVYVIERQPSYVFIRNPSSFWYY
jgi:hypothetical protein